MMTTEQVEPERGKGSLRGSLARAWSTTLQPQRTEESAQKSGTSRFVSKRNLKPEEVTLDIGDMADFEEANEEERDESRLLVVKEEEECDGGGDDADERTPKIDDEVEGVITGATSSQSIGSHLLTRNMFVLEVASNRSIRFAIYVVYLVFVASIILEFVYAYDDSEGFFAISVRPSNANGSFCYPLPNGTCTAYDEVNSTEASLLTNTGVVSSGLNVSDWEGTGARPGTPPFSASQRSALFMIDSSTLEYSANPQLHQYWNDTVAMIWTGYSGVSGGYFRVVNVDIKFERTDGMDWPAEMADEPFRVRIEGYACLRGKNCTNIGDWRLMVVDEEVSFYPVRSVRGNVYQARITVYRHYLNEQVVDSLVWRHVILADPGGAVSESLNVDEGTTAVVAKIGISGDPDNLDIVAVVDLILLAVYVVFILWWSYTLRKRSGKFVEWATENKWLLTLAVGFILSVNPIVVGLQLYLTRNEDAAFNEQWWAAAMIISGLGQSLLYFVFACFADLPRRFVTTFLRFYGGKMAFCTIFFVTWALAQAYRFPTVSGWDEPGTAIKLGGQGYMTAPQNWNAREQATLSWLMVLLVVELIFAFGYYAWSLVMSRKVLKALPYSMTRPIQLSSRFFFWVTSLWVLVEFILVIVSIVKVIQQNQDYFVHLDTRSRLVVALDGMYFLDAGVSSIYSEAFGLVFLIIFQCFFLPSDAFGGLIRKEKTHYVSEQEADHDGTQGQAKHLMVLEMARLLLVCSREVYLPFDEEEREKREQPLKKASSNANWDVKVTASKAISIAKGAFRIPQTDSSKLSDEGKKGVAAKDSGNDLSVVQIESSSEGAEPKAPEERFNSTNDLSDVQNESSSEGVKLEAPEERLDSTNDLSGVQSESPSEGAELEAPEMRIAGELGSSAGFLPWESTSAMGCTVVARLSEPEGTDMHNTRALILRHTESGDLIVSFRGTLTKKQVQTDLMSSKVFVDLDTFLTSMPKRCRDVRNIGDVQDEVGRISPDIVEEKIRSGEITKIRLMDLLPKQEHDELPDYLRTSTKVTDGIDGLCKLHFGFWSSYSRIRRQLHLTVREELLARPGRLLVTGHSLGGAQATICAYDLSRWAVLTVRKELLKTTGRVIADKIKLMCYTFGSPRVGNRAFQVAYNKLVPNTQRIVNDGDVVTDVPPARLGFRHVGRENIFDRVGSIRVDPSLIEHNFTTQKTAVDPHMLKNYRDVVQKSFNPIMSEAQLLDLIRTAYGYKG